MHPSTSKSKRQRVIALTIAGLAVAVGIGFIGGQQWTEHRYPMLKNPAFHNLDAAYQEIMNDYLEGAKGNDLLHGAAEGMTASLQDPYSVYYTGQEGKDYVQRYDDHFVGIGVELREENGEFVINSAIKGAPAEKAGLRKDDVIVSVAGQNLKGKGMNDLLKLTRGEANTKVKLSIRREGLAEPFDVTIVRANVPVTTVAADMLAGGIGRVQISRFADRTAEEFNTEVDRLLKQGMKGLLLDLRMNPGGLVSPTIAIANRLIPKGKTILQVVYKNNTNEITYKSKQKEPWNLPIVVLVDESSASSAEVLAAALKESAGAELVGVKTYGKGIVQTFQQFKDGSVLKLTESQWRTPEGKWIHKIGIQPNVTVTMPAYARLPILPTDRTLAVGQYGQEVKTAEQMLEAIGYGVGKPEGIYDAETVKGVEAFQRAERLTPDGKVNSRTAYQLMDRLREKIIKEDPQQQKGIEELKKRL
jgi:carboxyl-terminal processing protease